MHVVAAFERRRERKEKGKQQQVAGDIERPGGRRVEAVAQHDLAYDDHNDCRDQEGAREREHPVDGARERLRRVDP